MQARSFTATAALLTLLVAALLAAGPAAPQSPAYEDWSIERIERTVEIVPGAAITIENPYGQIRVRSGTDGEILVVANAQRHVDDPRAPLVEVMTQADSVAVQVYCHARPSLCSRARLADIAAVRVRWAEAEGVPPEIPEEWRKRRVDVSVLVPAAAPLLIEAADDLVELKGTAGEVTVRTVSGDVRLRTEGAVDVSTERGQVFVQLPALSWSAPSRIVTQTGEVVVYLRNGLDARLEVATEGEITTDYTLTVERGPRPSLRKQAVAVLGEGGPLMEIESVRGAIKLLELYLLDPSSH